MHRWGRHPTYLLPLSTSTFIGYDKVRTRIDLPGNLFHPTD